MKLYRLIFGVAVCLPIVFSCVKDDSRFSNDAMPKEGEEIKISFLTNLSPEIEIATRTAANITDLMILVFDEDYHYLSRSKAILGGVDANGRKFEATLISSAKNRYVHFIAGYDWTNFEDDYDLIGSDEGDIIPRLIVNESTNPANRKTTYWSRIALDGTAGYGTGISENSFGSNVVMLTRNRAKMTLTVDPGVTNFTLKGYAVYNQPDRGNIAAFRYSGGNYTFAEGTLTVPADASQLPPPTVGNYVTEGQPIEFFEWNNNNENSNIRMFIVFYGDYTDAGGTVYPDCYYKLDFVHSNNLGEVLDIIRNTHYHFELKTIDTEGYADPTNAAVAPAGNNIFASLELQPYPSISDGVSMLRVSQLEDIITESTMTFTTRIDYIPDITNMTAYEPSAITITPLGKTDVTYWDLSYSTVGGSVVAVIGLMPGKTIPSAIEQPMIGEYKVVAGKIVRTLKVTARSPYNLNATTSLIPTPTIDQGGDATISFDVPGTIASNLFPLKLYIDAKFLSPDLNYVEGIQVETGGGNYKYVYEIAETLRGTTITLHFKVNKNAGTNEAIILSATPYFAPQTLIVSWL